MTGVGKAISIFALAAFALLAAGERGKAGSAGEINAGVNATLDRFYRQVPGAPRLSPKGAAILWFQPMGAAGHCPGARITFEAEVDPGAVTICHCTDCQRLTGSAFRANVVAPTAHFGLHGDTLKSYVKTAESGNQRRHAFCGECGTP